MIWDNLQAWNLVVLTVGFAFVCGNIFTNRIPSSKLSKSKSNQHLHAANNGSKHQSTFVSFVLHQIKPTLKNELLQQPHRRKDPLYFQAGPVFETHLTAQDFDRAKQMKVEDAIKNAKQAALAEQAIYNPALFEGDITFIAANSRLAAAFGIAPKKETYKPLRRNAMRSFYQLYADGIVPYSMSSEYTPYARSIIAAALSDIEAKTCVKFVPRTNERDYMYVEPLDGCSSAIGKTGGKQSLSLGAGCLIKGIIQHEVLHVLGIFHEQSRQDRDEFVDVNWDNIQSDMRDNFQKYTWDVIDPLGSTYDYGSIMHYSDTAFSKNGQATIQPKNRDRRIGQRIKMSDVDILRLNRLYHCTDKIDKNGQPPPLLPPPNLPTGNVPVGEVDAGNSLITDFGEPSPATIPWNKPLIEPKPDVIGSTGLSKIAGPIACSNHRTDCSFLKTLGYCKSQKAFMAQHCTKACSLCGSYAGGGLDAGGLTGNTIERSTNPFVGSRCFDLHFYCSKWAEQGNCDAEFISYMQINCRKSCGFC